MIAHPSIFSCAAIGMLLTLQPLSAQTPEIDAEVKSVLHNLRTAGPAAISPIGADTLAHEVAIQDLTAKIDRHLAKFWTDNKIKPAGIADDAEFLRRVSLDLIGRIPSVSEVRKFVADTNPKKRERKVRELLNKAAFVNYFSSVLRQQWVPQTASDPQLLFVGAQFENWLKSQVRQNTSYDKVVREILTAPTLFNQGRGGRVDFEQGNSPFAFNQANEFKPENVAASASRLFMGVKLECAQCHNHPFEDISRDQFWQTAAFFAELQPVIANLKDAQIKREIIIQDVDPKKRKKVVAKFFDGKEPKWKDEQSPREVFVNWLTSKDNPYFAKNAVERTWAHFFGLGFIDPIDEPSEKNPELIPALVADMAKAFQASGYDNRFLIKAITQSKAYQLTSKQSDSSQHNPRHFARMPVKAMSADQLYDSLGQATGVVDANAGNPQQRIFGRGPRRDFLTKFASTERSIERQTSILQALTLMNGQFVKDQTSLERSSFLAGIMDAPFMNPGSRVEAIFLATLSRLPSVDESQKFSSYVQRSGTDYDEKKALTDVFWALLNSSEFILNH